MLEIARAIRRHPQAAKVFDLHFMSEGGQFESLITKAGFTLKLIEPRMTESKIERAYKLDKGEAFGAVLPDDEIAERVQNELSLLREIEPVAIVTGSYFTIPITSRIADIPLVWVVQSTWSEDFFTHGAGMTEKIHFKPIRKIADGFIFKMLETWMNASLLKPLNRIADKYGVRKITDMFDYYRGNLNLVAETPGFTSAQLPIDHQFVGPIIAQEDFLLPDEVVSIPRDLPIVYFAMGSSGTAQIVRNILWSFEGQQFRVIAPVKSIIGDTDGMHIPRNVVLTDWLPAQKVNKMADVSVIHGGIGTIMTACYAGKPIVGVAMQPEQSANLAAVVRKEFAISIPKSKDPSKKVIAAVHQLLNDDNAKRKAKEFAAELESWKGADNAAEILLKTYGEASTEK